MEVQEWRDPQPVHLSLTFKDFREAKELYEELHTWTPHGGWSTLAKNFFTGLLDAATEE